MQTPFHRSLFWHSPLIPLLFTLCLLCSHSSVHFNTCRTSGSSVLWEGRARQPDQEALVYTDNNPQTSATVWLQPKCTAHELGLADNKILALSQLCTERCTAHLRYFCGMQGKKPGNSSQPIDGNTSAQPWLKERFSLALFSVHQQKCCHWVPICYLSLIPLHL